MQITQLLSSILNKKSTFYFLLGFTGLVSLVLFFINIKVVTGDEYTYMYYVKGMHQGRYTYWYFIKDYIPDTFRNPGYPVFLYLLSFINDSVTFVKAIQLLLLFAAIFFMLRIIEKYDNSLLLKNLFLILVNINFVLLSYSALIFPEMLMLLLITLIVYIEISMENNNWTKVLLLALIYGYCFQVRPVILFIPFIRFLFFLYQYKKLSVIKNVTFITVFILTLLPYGFWNLKHHNKFKITPIEGGAGAMYLGYWSPKMINQLEDKLWRNVMYKDVMFNFAEMEDVPHNVELFNNEIDSVYRVCAKYILVEDTIHLTEMRKHTNLFVTHNAKYTEEREKLFNSLSVMHYVKDWKYTIKLKTYSFFRLWYTGLSFDEKGGKKSLTTLLPNIIAFVGTFTTVILFIVYFLTCLWKRKDIIKKLAIPLMLCFYFAFFHVPFVIQSRYTIPVRMLYLFSLAFMIYKIHFTQKNTHEPHQNI